MPFNTQNSYIQTVWLSAHFRIWGKVGERGGGRDGSLSRSGMAKATLRATGPLALGHAERMEVTFQTWTWIVSEESQFTTARTGEAKTHGHSAAHMWVQLQTSAAKLGGKGVQAARVRLRTGNEWGQVTGPCKLWRGHGHGPMGDGRPDMFEAGAHVKANTHGAVSQAKCIVGAQFLPGKQSNLLWRHLWGFSVDCSLAQRTKLL